jgi:hypothetical protein
MAVFMEPGELAQIQADYRTARWLMTEGRDNIVKAAVEWYDFIDSTRGPIDAEGYALKVVALSDAVKRWKEAQA